MPQVSPSYLTLQNHVEVLRWIESPGALAFDADQVGIVHIWALVALSALLDEQSSDQRIQVRRGGTTATARFTHAVGFEALIGGSAPYLELERGRTVRLRQVRRFDEIETVASEISRLLLMSAEAEDTRRTLYYILVEFLRNAVQHSGNPRGAIVGAQLMDRGHEYRDRSMIQIAVADAGIGIMESLRTTYPEAQDPHQAIVMAQQPWVSSQFQRGLRGGAQNAGLGLYFISEMAKKTAGRFLTASRGGSLLLQGDESYQQHHHIQDEQFGFPGTLAVFELPVGEIQDYGALISLIQDLAKERIPATDRIRWLRFDPSPTKGTFRLGVRVGAEDTNHAQGVVREHLLPRIFRGEPVELDFRGLRVCTQSFLHALLFTVLREAYSRRVPIHVTSTSPAVSSAIDFLESYALSNDAR